MNASLALIRSDQPVKRLAVAVAVLFFTTFSTGAQELEPCGPFERALKRLVFVDCPSELAILLSKFRVAFDQAMALDKGYPPASHWSEERKAEEAEERRAFDDLEVWQETRQDGRPKGNYVASSKIREWSLLWQRCRGSKVFFDAGVYGEEEPEELTELCASAQERLHHWQAEDMRRAFRIAEAIEKERHTHEAIEAEWQAFVDDYNWHMDEPTDETRELLQRARRRRVFWADGGRFEERSPGVLFDSLTGTLWTEKPNPTDVNLAGARGYCRQLRALNRSGWRVPTLPMLESILKPKPPPGLNRIWSRMPKSFDLDETTFNFLWTLTPRDETRIWGWTWEGHPSAALPDMGSGMRTLCVLSGQD